MSVGLDLNKNKSNNFVGPGKTTNNANLSLNFGQKSDSSSAKSKMIVATSSIIGTIVPMIFIAKHQNKALKFNSLKDIKEIFKIKYQAKEMVAISGTAIVAGVAAGVVSDKEHKRKHKIKEGVFQFLYASVPPLLVEFFDKQITKSKNFNNIPGKIAGIVAGIGGGMVLATMVANKITDPEDKEADRKIKPKDLILSLDDALGALVIAKLPFVDKLPVSKVLPAVFAWCGYRAGKHE